MKYQEPRPQKSHGQQGENLAQSTLRKKGYAILSANFFSRYGEIDIVAIKDGVIHFCEVKTRTGETFGTPEEAVNWKKLQKIKKTIQCYQEQHGYTPWQIDMIAVRLTPADRGRKSIKITHYLNIS